MGTTKNEVPPASVTTLLKLDPLLSSPQARVTPSKTDAGYVRMPEAEFEAMLSRAAEQGARRALADVGLDGPDAAIDSMICVHCLKVCVWRAARPGRLSSGC
ncbi:MAG: hypothetical protein ACI92Z_003054 [Paracoccaceae bacterium]|jgi:hypothetical protein